MNVTGTVEQIGTKNVNTQYGSKPTYSARVNGQWYKFGFKNPGIAVGDTVALEYTPGKWGNDVTSTSKVANAAPAATPVTPAPAGATYAAGRTPAPTYGGKGVFPIPALDGQRSIVRQNALTNARELFAAAAFGSKGGALDIDSAASAIIQLAKRFEAYTAGDMDMEAAVASIKEEEKKAA